MGSQKMRLSKLDQSVRDPDENAKEAKRQQADGHRLTIRENVDFIRLQKQLSEKSAALLLVQEKLNMLKEVYEAQLQEGGKALQESQEKLLEKVEELNGELKEERQKSLALESQLAAANMALQSQQELKERVLQLEEERNSLKQCYNALVESTLTSQRKQREMPSPERDVGLSWKQEIQRVVDRLSVETKEKDILIEEHERIRVKAATLEELRRDDKAFVDALREKHSHLENEVLVHKKEVAMLQERLDSVTQVFNMSVEELSETLLQIKAFRLQQENQKGTSLLDFKDKREVGQSHMASLEACYAETVFELQKTRDLLLIQHRISADLQAELKTVVLRASAENHELKRKLAEKERMLKSRMKQIISLQAQLREMAYSPKLSKRTQPTDYSFPGRDQEDVTPVEEESVTFHLRRGESLLEVHLQEGTFTPLGLRAMGQAHSKDLRASVEVTTFYTYSLLDFETHSTPLVSGLQPKYGFTSRYALSTSDLTKLVQQGAMLKADLHQKLGGVVFETCGRAQIPLLEAFGHRGEQLSGAANVTGKDGEIIGVLEYWVCLSSPTGSTTPMLERPTADRKLDLLADTRRGTAIPWRELTNQSWQDPREFGSTGAPNELEVHLDRCFGLRARWPGVLPDAYFTYQLYDLPPYTSSVQRAQADPVFEDAASYPISLTSDVWDYLCSSKLWVYLFDEREDQIPPIYLAKTSISLDALAKGRPIRGCYILRDSSGNTKGTLRVSLRWKHEFQAVTTPQYYRQGTGPDREIPDARQIKMTHSGPHTIPKAVANPRLKESRRVEIPERDSHEFSRDEEDTDRSRSSSSSDVVVITPQPKPLGKGNKLRVEILSLSLHPNSRVAMDQSVQRVYVEYRLLGVPMETTETPLSLRKPTDGQEIHYNFIRVIYVDNADAAPLRHYLYTMLEGLDPNNGRLKFTVVSEPLSEEEECVDVGYAFLDLKELLLTGNDIKEKQIDILSLSDNDEEVMGHLKISLEAATALTGIYQEYVKKGESKKPKRQGHKAKHTEE